ncbi:MAG: hypothetical protein P8I55_11205 [Crocinitomix sp.]|nr:hypothetical protein [Crocinitomix sp.]
MSKRVLTSYKKLNATIKNAIQAEYPDGVEEKLTKMKHVIKGYFFNGLIFNYDDITYLIEWGDVKQRNNVNINDDLDGEDVNSIETEFEAADLE